MADNLRPGERVSWNQGAGDTYVVEPLNGYIVRVRNERTGESWFPRRQDLTRIEPDVPQPKYRVGQRVRLKNDALDFPGEMGQVIHLGYYVSRSGHWGTWVVERKLEAVPEVCQTCGGTGADYRHPKGG